MIIHLRKKKKEIEAKKFDFIMLCITNPVVIMSTPFFFLVPFEINIFMVNEEFVFYCN